MFTKRQEGGYRSLTQGVEQKTLVHGPKSSLSRFQLKKGSLIAGHSHPHEQTGYLLSGRMRLRVGSRSHLCEPGDSWCIAAHTEHSAEILEDSVAIEVFCPPRTDYLS